jgi:hypothetical protein
MKKDITSLFYCTDNFAKGMDEEINDHRLKKAGGMLRA